MLAIGSVGAEVTFLQERLVELGFAAGPVDGWFGAATAAAVSAFQTSAGVSADGVVGPQTWAALSGQQ